MRTCIAGNGTNSTAAVQSYLLSTPKPLLRKLFIIGYPEDPYALFLTDHEAPLQYSVYPGAEFQPARISRGPVKAVIGLETQSVSLEYSVPPMTFTQSVATASPLQLAFAGYYDNWPVTMFTAFMKPGGDINTLGCCVDFKGRIAESEIDRAKVKWTVNSLLDILNSQKIPTNVIRNSATQIAYTGAIEPAGETSGVPTFAVVAPSSNNVILGDVFPPYATHHIFGTNKFIRGFIVFLASPGSTLAGFYSAVAANALFAGVGHNSNQFTLYSQLPWAPTPWSGTSGDQFYASATPPVDASQGATDIFSYVPSPESAA